MTHHGAEKSRNLQRNRSHWPRSSRRYPQVPDAAPDQPDLVDMVAVAGGIRAPPASGR